MNANQYRSKLRATVYLPIAGMEAVVRRVSVATLAANGQIPQTLQTIAEDFVGAPDKEITLAEFPKYADVVNMIVKAAMVEPRVGDEATDEQLDVREMEFEDRIAVFNFVNAGASALRPFRAEQNAGVEPVSNDNGVSRATVADSASE